MLDREEIVLNFHEMEIDNRILKAIALLGWSKPTLIQEKAIPLILEGKDVLLKARTGSGKTAAFATPIIQKILNFKAAIQKQVTTAIVLAPSKELCQQIKQVFDQLTIKCSLEISSVDISNYDKLTQKHLLSENPDIVISTPGKLLCNIENGNINFKQDVQSIVVDEADLIFSYGFETEVNGIINHLPVIYQAILASATLSEDVQKLKNFILHNPVVLKLNEPNLAPIDQMSHYHIMAEEKEKATILYSLFKLHLIRGKSIIFVKNVDRCYKLKLFMEQFGIRTCVLNSELPANIRCHAVNQFNLGNYDTIISSDERKLENPATIKNIKTKRNADNEFDLARGIDFQCVSNVVNFDFPININSYIHRAGRTARGNNTGSVLSFVSQEEEKKFLEVENHLKFEYGSEDVFKKYQFKLDEVEAFNYRSNDIWRAITRLAVKQARLKEIKNEIFNTEKLKSYFNENPKDLEVLRHDKPLNTVKLQAHLVDVPDYIVPEALKTLSGMSKLKRKTNCNRSTIAKGKHQVKFNNPLLCAAIDHSKKRK